MPRPYSGKRTHAVAAALSRLALQALLVLQALNLTVRPADLDVCSIQNDTCHRGEPHEDCRRMNRIVERFTRLRKEGQKGFVVYIGAGDPDLDATRQLALALDRAGVDVLELGVPFSDPLADGLVNQLAAQRGLESGTTPPKVLATVGAIRRDSQIPLVLYIYFNLVHRYGFKKFIVDAAEAGVDGLLVLDLPPEESENYESMMREAQLCV